MTSPSDPLDETAWSKPEAVARMGGIHENTIHPYFAESPFFDTLSNNATLLTQAFNPGRAHIAETREAFETTLRQMQGLEYMITSGPKDFAGEAHINLGRWVIRKQTRNKRPGAPDEVKVLQTYYVIGDTIYQAPSIENILWSRVISVTDNLNKLSQAAATLPLFQPALGHHYLPVSSGKPGTSADRTRQGSRTATPGAASMSRTSTSPPPHHLVSFGKTASGPNFADMQTLVESFTMFQKYRDEYMDENPLVGEPGSFTFSHSKTQLQSQQKAAQTQASQLQVNTRSSSTVKNETPSSQPAEQQDQLVNGEAFEDRDARQMKMKRRRSKVAESPT